MEIEPHIGELGCLSDQFAHYERTQDLPTFTPLLGL